MSTRLRLGPTFSFCVALLLLAQGAAAQLGPPCWSSAECDDGFACSVESVRTTDAGAALQSMSEEAIEEGADEDGGTGNATDSEAARPQLPDLPPIDLGGNCVPDLQPCKQNTDCQSGYHCELHGTGANTRSCEESGTCNASEAGEGAWLCAPDDSSCKADSDCPEPAVCADGECVYEFNWCEADSDCDTRYVCTALENDDDCDAESEQDPRRCEDFVHVCFPPPIACESDVDCSGWQCHSTSRLSSSPPIGWEVLDKGCMPEGLVALLDQRIEPGGDLVESTAGDGDSQAAATPPEADAGLQGDEDNSGSNDAAADDHDADDHDDDDTSVNADDDGCNVAPGRARSAWVLPAWLALALLGFRRTRRVAG